MKGYMIIMAEPQTATFSSSYTLKRVALTYLIIFTVMNMAIYGFGLIDTGFPYTLFFQLTMYGLTVFIVQRGLKLSTVQIWQRCHSCSWLMILPAVLCLVFLFQGNISEHFFELLEQTFVIALPEEWIFRGIYQYDLERIFGKWKGLIICSFLFSLLHIPRWLFWADAPVGIVLSQVLSVAISGIIYGFFMNETHSLPFVVLLHAVTNMHFIPWAWKVIVYLALFASLKISSFLLSKQESTLS